MVNHVFSASQTLPNGVRITTAITAPEDAAWPDLREMNEIAGMGTSWTTGHVQKSIARAREECPF